MNVVVGSVGLSKYFGAVSPVYYMLRPRNSDDLVEFYDAIFQDSVFQMSLFGLGNGIMVIESKSSGKLNTIRMRIPMWKLRRVLIVHPSPEEQAAIVRFLDHANRKIDGFIRAKRKLIGLLTEQKQAIIQEAVFGIEQGSDVRSIPIRAAMRPTKRLGHPDKTILSLSLFRDYGVIRKDSRENKNVDVRDPALCQLVECGDVVMNKMKAWQGSIAVSDLEGIASPDYMVLQITDSQIVPKFLHYLLRSPAMVAEYRKNAYGVRPGQWRLMYPEFCRLRLKMPNTDNQKLIVERIERDTRSADTAIARTQQEIDLMQEYRTRLTADVVTGKLDVREAAAQLPDEAPEHSEAEDDNTDFAEEDESFAEEVEA